MANCYATGATTQTAVVKENTWGVTPGTPQTAIVPFLNNTLDGTRDVVSSEAQNGDRMKRFSRHGNVNVAGDIDVELAHETFDLLFESALMNSWTGDSIKVGNTPVSLSVEVGDTSKNVYQVYKGVIVNEMSIEASLGALVSTTFGCMGKSVSDSTTSIDSTPEAAPNKQPFHTGDTAGSISIDGSDPGIVTDISITVSNNLDQNFSLFENEASCLTSTAVTVEGTVTLFLKDLTFINKFRNETTSTIVLTCNDGNGNSVSFTVPKAKWNSANLPSQGAGTRTITMEFEGLYDSASDTVFRMNRS